MIVGLAAAALLPIACRERGEAPESPGAPLAKGGKPEGDGAFLGLTEAEGAALAKSRQLTYRVIAIDGEPRPATKDYRPNRVNFELRGGRIVKTTRG